MTIHTVTLKEQIDAIDRLLIAGRNQIGTRNIALKAIAADLRSRLPGTATNAVTELQKRIENVKKSKGPLGYSNGTLVSLGQELIARWPVVKAALEKFETEVSK